MSFRARRRFWKERGGAGRWVQGSSQGKQRGLGAAGRTGSSRQGRSGHQDTKVARAERCFTAPLDFQFATIPWWAGRGTRVEEKSSWFLCWEISNSNGHPPLFRTSSPEALENPRGSTAQQAPSQVSSIILRLWAPAVRDQQKVQRHLLGEIHHLPP